MTHLCQVTMPLYTGIPEDSIVNTFHFNWAGGGDPDSLDWVFLKNKIRDFYTAVFTNSGTAGMAPYVNQTAVGFKAWDLTDPVPRAPVFSETYSGAAVQSGSSYLPSEVAICLSYHGAPVSGLDQRNRRGRIYLGGLGSCGTAATSGTPTVMPRPTSTIMNNMSTAAHDLLTIVAPGGAFVWVVYSPTLAAIVGPPGDATPVVGGWVDDAFDTQRRRGQAASLRQIWS